MNLSSFINAPTEDYEKRKFHIVETIDRFRSLYKAKPNNSNIPDEFVTIKSFQQLDEKQKTRFPQILEMLKGSKTWSQIVTVYDYFEQSNKFYIVMEYGETTLKQYIQKNQTITLLQKLKYCQQICESIKFIHDNGHMHRDIRPENFVMIEYKQKIQLVKLTDFGIMRDDPPENCEQTEIADCTYQTYTAPEILRQQKYDKKCDIWSLGCVFYEILTGKPLFNQNSINSKQIYDEQYINSEIQKITIPQQLMEIIQQMMKLNPEIRPEIKDIIKILIDNKDIIERQYEMILIYHQQENLHKWVDDLRQTLLDDKKMNQDQVDSFFIKLVQATQKQKSEVKQQQNQFSNIPQFQKFEGNQQFQEKYRFSKQFQNNNNVPSPQIQVQQIEKLKIPEPIQPKQNTNPQFQPNQPNFQQPAFQKGIQQPSQQESQQFNPNFDKQQPQPQQFVQVKPNNNFQNPNTFANQQNKQGQQIFGSINFQQPLPQNQQFNNPAKN